MTGIPSALPNFDRPGIHPERSNGKEIQSKEVRSDIGRVAVVKVIINELIGPAPSCFLFVRRSAEYGHSRSALGIDSRICPKKSSNL